MPNEEEIISLLRRLKGNEPEKYNQYIEHYKKNYPDFYKKKLAPVFEEKPVMKKEMPQVNPAEQLDTGIKPIGSANVGEELGSNAGNKKRGSAEQTLSGMSSSELTQSQPNKKEVGKQDVIHREKNWGRTALIVGGIIVALVIIGGLVYFFLL